MRRTNPRIFEPQLMCTTCDRPVRIGERAGADECDLSDGGDTDVKACRDFVLGAEHVGPIVLTRRNGVAAASIEHRFVVHSPTGFEWGYGGSGPADLALNILALFVEPPEAWRLHQDFKWYVIARLPADGAVIEPERVREWIKSRWEHEDANTARNREEGGAKSHV